MHYSISGTFIKYEKNIIEHLDTNIGQETNITDIPITTPNNTGQTMTNPIIPNVTEIPTNNPTNPNRVQDYRYINNNMLFSGNEIRTDNTDLNTCLDTCFDDNNCAGVSYSNNKCVLKNKMVEDGIIENRTKSYIKKYNNYTNKNYPNNNLQNKPFNLNDIECMNLCDAISECEGVTYIKDGVNNKCYLKNNSIDPSKLTSLNNAVTLKKLQTYTQPMNMDNNSFRGQILSNTKEDNIIKCVNKCSNNINCLGASYDNNKDCVLYKSIINKIKNNKSNYNSFVKKLDLKVNSKDLNDMLSNNDYKLILKYFNIFISNLIYIIPNGPKNYIEHDIFIRNLFDFYNNKFSQDDKKIIIDTMKKLDQITNIDLLIKNIVLLMVSPYTIISSDFSINSMNSLYFTSLSKSIVDIINSIKNIIPNKNLYNNIIYVFLLFYKILNYNNRNIPINM